MTDVFYLVLRRMRFPLILIIVIYGFCIIGLSAMPGIDEAGNPTKPISLFEAFYVISYTGTTIGFGELPNPYSPAQRLWMTLSIYLTVIGWSYSVVNVFALVQEHGFQLALNQSRFARRVAHLREPFYIVAGCGETGMLICHGLDRLGLRFVVLERDDERLQEMLLEEFQGDAPMLNADASQPRVLERAGLLSPYCRGVMALTEDDDTNEAVAVTVRLLAPRVPVLARVRNRRAENRYGAFVGDVVINPFTRFAEHLVAAIAAPEAFRLRELLTGLPGEELPERHRPPAGHWIICGYGRFGSTVARHLEQVGVELTVIDTIEDERGEIDVIGSGTDPDCLVAAGIDRAQGIVAGNRADTQNLAIAVAARDLNPNIFVVTRRNERANAPLFDAFTDDLCMVPSRIVAQEFLARITTPPLARFLHFLTEHDEQWSADLYARVAALHPGRTPEVWSVTVSGRRTEALADHLRAGDQVTLRELLVDPFELDRPLRTICLMHTRDGEDVALPSEDIEVRLGEELLMVGPPRARRRLDLTLRNANVLDHVRRGREGHASYVWRWLTRKS